MRENRTSGSMSGWGKPLTAVGLAVDACLETIESGSRSTPMFDSTDSSWRKCADAKRDGHSET
jgi:hypothetical protein